MSLKQTERGVAKRPFEPLDELRYRFIGEAKLAPDGKTAVYTLTCHHLADETTDTVLWQIDLNSGETRQLTPSRQNCTSPTWSPDGRWLAFVSDRTGKPQIYRLPSDGGEAQQLTQLEQGVGGGPVWSPNGHLIAFTAGVAAEPVEPTHAYRLKRTVYRFDGLGNLDNAIQNIFVVAVENGEPQQLTTDEHRDHGLRWAPDGSQLLFLASHDPDRLECHFAKLRLVDLKGEVVELLGLDWDGVEAAEWLRDGTGVLLETAVSGQWSGVKTDLWTLQIGAVPENRTAALKWGVAATRSLSVSAETALVNVSREGAMAVYEVTLADAEQWQPVIEGERTAVLLDANPHHILFLNNTNDNPGELWLANRDGSNQRQLTHVNREMMATIAFPTMTHLRFANDGVPFEGWMLLPTQGEPPHPTVLYIHGGPHGMYGYHYRHDFQMLAGAGFGVLFMNPRGSSGYGNDFTAPLAGNWGVLDYGDLMAGVDAAIAQGLADPDRLGVCGLSYGGYMACFIVGQTDRFKAAVAENPITDLVSWYGTADMGPWGAIGQFGGRPHEVPDVYRRSSPITYAHRCTTPTLLVQGEADFRCPAGQSEQFYTHLKVAGCPTEMVRLPAMSHIGSMAGLVAVQKAQNEALLGWMKQFVL